MQKKLKTRSLCEMVYTKKLQPDPNNDQLFGPNDSNFGQIVQSMKEKGFLINHPILCNQKDKKLIIISGHRRWRAALEIGLVQVPVTIISVTDEREIERIMIEENLLRPQEGRKFSHLERYLLALKLSASYPEKRGGDRRSADFGATCGPKSTHKDTWLSEKTGLCTKYINQLSVIAKKICDETSKNYPQISGKPLSEQLQIVLEDNLSPDLSDLQAGTTTISSIYHKYKTPKLKQTRPELIHEKHISNVLPDCADDHKPQKNIDTDHSEHQDPTSTFIRSFITYLSTEFVTNTNLSKAMQILSLPHQDHVATLIAVKKVATLLLHTSREQGSKAKNIEAQSLPLFNNNGGLK